jgi:hypothetical protein
MKSGFYCWTQQRDCQVASQATHLVIKPASHRKHEAPEGTMGEWWSASRGGLWKGHTGPP